MDGVRERVEANTIGVSHARFDRIHTPVHPGFHRLELMRQGDEVSPELIGGSLELADVDTRGTSIGLHLLRIRLQLIHALLQTIDIAPQEHGLGTRLAKTRLQLKDTRLDLVDIGAQSDDIEIDAVGDGAMDVKFTADVVVLAVPAVDITILGEDGRAELVDPRVQLVHAVMEVDQRGFGPGRCCDGRARTGHGKRGAGAGVAPFEGGHGGHVGSGCIYETCKGI